MVVIHLKKTEVDQFLYECRTTDSNDTVIRDLCTIHNLRDKVARTAGAVEELGKHGPMKPEADKGLDEIQEQDGKKIERGPYYNADPIGHRNGNAPAPKLQEVLNQTANDAKSLVGRDHATAGIALTPRMLQEKLDTMRGAVSMAFPMGLPDNDTVKCFLEDTADDGFLQDAMGPDYMDPATATLWWAGKEFFRDQTVADRVGKNEKTKIVARLAKKGGGQPVREPVINDEERKAMMAWYFKKQEEEKAIAEDREDGYLASSWADPKALKSSLLGTTSLNFMPGGGGGGARGAGSNR